MALSRLWEVFEGMLNNEGNYIGNLMYRLDGD